MRTILPLLLVCGLLLSACGGSRESRQLEELQSRSDDLAKRVSTLEKDLLAAEKKLIAQEQEFEKAKERIRTMENSFHKMELGQ